MVGTRVARGSIARGEVWRNKHWPDEADCYMDFGLFCFSKGTERSLKDLK